MAIMITALHRLGVKRAMVAHGEGMDEFTTCGPTDIMELREGKISKHVVDYSDYGLKRATVDDLRGGSPEENLALARGVLANKGKAACVDIVVFNAAAGLMLAGQAAGFAEGIAMARESIASGKAMGCLEKMVEISNE